MNFTDAEKELSKQLKEAGLEWNPEFGDVVLYHRDFFMVWYSAGKFVVCTPQEVEVGVDDKKGEYHYQSHYNLMQDNVLWVPCWHQCREELLKRGWFINNHFDHNKKVILQISNGIYGFYNAEGNTDLEAMYRVLLKVI